MLENSERGFDWKKAIATCYFTNTILLVLVIGMAIFYAVFDVKVMVYLSAIYLVPYIANYFFIAKGHTNTYIRMVYALLTIYMCIATVSLGISYGFNLYCMSIIPIIFILKYLGYKVGKEAPNPYYITAVIIICYVGCTVYAIVRGPLYVINDTVAAVLLAINSLAVFGFLVAYSRILVTTVINSDKELTKLAVNDPMTKLYNRRYMMKQIREAAKDRDGENAWIAMIDLDDFKNINDTYGHGAGDKCILFISDTLKECCENCTLSRWGGDEFLILSDGSMRIADLEKLKVAVENGIIEEDGQKYSITVTIGAAKRKNLTAEQWINLADKRMYQGKTNGKNTVCVGKEI